MCVDVPVHGAVVPGAQLGLATQPDAGPCDAEGTSLVTMSHIAQS